MAGNTSYTVVMDTNFSSDRALDDLNDEAFWHKLPAIIYTILMMVLGLPGNMVVFYIYFFKWRHSTSRMFILFLAALDAINCATTLPAEIVTMTYSLKFDYPVLCKVSRYSTFVMNSSSALILVGIATDRFKRICRPYQRSFSEDKSMYISIASIVCAMCSTWPALALYGTRRTVIPLDDSGNVTCFSCKIQNNFDGTLYPMIYIVVMYTSTILLFAILTILYYHVGKQIYIHRNFKMKNCTHVQKVVDEKSVTVRSEKSLYDKSKSSNSPINPSPKDDPSNTKSNKEGYDTSPELGEVNGNALVVIEEPATTVAGPENGYDENKLRPYQLGLPIPIQDAGTSCGLLDVPNACQNGSCSSDRSEMDVSTHEVSFDSRATCDQLIKDTEPEDVPQTKEVSPQQRKKARPRRKTKRVRYMLVRGASTLHSSSRRCNCLTVRIGRSTLMLFLITIAYVISFVPFYVLLILREMRPGQFEENMSSVTRKVYEVFFRSYLLSSAINPFIYSFCNAQFRDYCKELFMKVVLRRSSFQSHGKFPRRY